MTTTKSFKEEFYLLCEPIGVKLSMLTSQLGNYDDISKDEHRAFVWFKNSNALFRIKNNHVDHLSIPKADAYGHKYEGPKEYYTLDGIKIGITKEEVIKKWGEPTGKSNRGWSYENKSIILQSGLKIVIGVGFDEDENDEFRVHQFSAGMGVEQPSKSLFSIFKWGK